METINNLAQTAAKVVWGEDQSKQEPVSGVQGDTSKGEPYDAGNMEPAKQKAAAKSSSNEPGDHTSAQNDTRNPDDAAKPPRDDVTTADSGPANTGAKLNEPGPKPLAAVAKEHGGDAGNRDEADARSVSSSSSSSSSSDEGKEHPKHSSNKGTGEQHVKSTGLKADGGDFDASKPGAGHEADRLLAEKGIPNPADPAATDESGDKVSESNSQTGDKDGSKRSLRERIKQKLHRP